MAENPESYPWHTIRLSDEDARRLDALLGESSDSPPDDEARTERLRELLRLLEQSPAGDPDPQLTQRTLERIREAENQQRLTEQVQMLSRSGPGPGLSLRQVGTVAAVLLIGVSLLLPALDHSRQIARQIACQANLHESSAAMNQYAAAHAGKMPRGKVEPGSVWWNVGQNNSENQPSHSNSAHLFLLIKRGYAAPHELTCPSNPHAHPERVDENAHDWPSAQAVSYSYQNQYTAKPIKLDRHPGLAVLADKNPLFVVRTGRVTHDAQRPMASPSRLHRNQGQNVLTADGVVRWTVRPTIRQQRGEDNFWVVQGITHYQGTETPQQPDDSFLVP